MMLLRRCISADSLAFDASFVIFLTRSAYCDAMDGAERLGGHRMDGGVGIEFRSALHKT